MKTGVWIDHKHAWIVNLDRNQVETRKIDSDLPRALHPAGGARARSFKGALRLAGDDIKERKAEGYTRRYYDRVIDDLNRSESILLAGPGEAKRELLNRVASAELRRRIMEMQTPDNMTERQFVAKVREYYAA